MRIPNIALVQAVVWGTLALVLAPGLSAADNAAMDRAVRYYRATDYEAALGELLIQNQMMKDFAMLERSLAGDEKVLYFEPAYAAILAKRVAVRVPAHFGVEELDL